MSGHVIQDKTFNVGVLHLPKMVRMFYEAGHVIERARASHIVNTSAYQDGALSRAIGWCIERGYDQQSAQTMEVVTDPISEVLGAELLMQFLTKLAEDPVDALAFASSVELRRQGALQRLIGLEQLAGDHDRALARSATKTMENLTAIMTVCGVAFSVGICVLSLGVLPAVLAGTEVGSQGAAAYLLSTGSSVILAKIRSSDNPNAMHACAVDADYSNKMLVAGYALDNRSETYKDAATKQLEMFKKCKRHVDGLNRLAGRKCSAWQRARLSAAKVAPQLQGAAAQAKGSVFKAGQYAFKGGSYALAVVSLKHDLEGVFEQRDEYDKINHQGNDN